MEINVQADLVSVNEQISKTAEELNNVTNSREQLIQEIGIQNLEQLKRITNAREELVQQIQHLNGAAMFLRGKLPPEGRVEVADIVDEAETENEFERSAEYPPDN
tara:strand:- start:45 stop:359 length:315 start_codon:yes stop_codon:yes gene_type:complete